jgi:proteasome assembly chaperone (PAC2) family protein
MDAGSSRARAMSELILDSTIRLRRPALIAAFSGWSDAVEASTRAIDFLRTTLGAVRVGEIPPGDFYDMTSTRPHIAVRAGVMQSFAYPTATIYAWNNADRKGPDLVLLESAEPSLRWPDYVGMVNELLIRCNVRGVYMLGSLFDGVAHTRPPRVSMAVAQQELRRRLARFGATPVDYEGPGTIHTALLEGCARQGVPAASLWGHVPAYAQVSWNPRTTLALLEIVLQAIELPLNLDTIRGQAAQLDALLDRLVESDDDLRRQVEEYEQRHDQDATASSLPSAEAILSEVEEFLRGGQDVDPADE